MRLEMAEFPVTEITLGSEFCYSSETLAINPGELKKPYSWEGEKGTGRGKGDILNFMPNPERQTDA